MRWGLSASYCLRGVACRRGLLFDGRGNQRCHDAQPLQGEPAGLILGIPSPSLAQDSLIMDDGEGSQRGLREGPCFQGHLAGHHERK
ncbi:hypothetical protein Q664_11815 [Archangium violaceum Cb vi76]|uniref:Uncharacterized protein n=1 Tax=Archangium violaceum Cb vi76 TaxID=1406225 RepID=A0A084SWY6_9BACT|nr:hypothetical protein Q664_11815 [Archangium violaceum Cb vi76]